MQWASLRAFVSSRTGFTKPSTLKMSKKSSAPSMPLSKHSTNQQEQRSRRLTALERQELRNHLLLPEHKFLNQCYEAEYHQVIERMLIERDPISLHRLQGKAEGLRYCRDLPYRFLDEE